MKKVKEKMERFKNWKKENKEKLQMWVVTAFSFVYILAFIAVVFRSVKVEIALETEIANLQEELVELQERNEALQEVEDGKTVMERRTFDSEEVISTNGRVSFVEVVYAVGTGCGCRYEREYFIELDNYDRVQVPEELVGYYANYGGTVLKVAENHALIYTGDFQIIKFDFETMEMEPVIGNAIWNMHTGNENVFWWVEESTGYVFDIESETTMEFPNVKGITYEFPGFYVATDDSRGTTTLNGRILPVVEPEASAWEAEVSGIKWRIGENCKKDRDYYVIEGKISFNDTDYSIDENGVIVVTVLYTSSTEDLDGYTDYAAVTLEEDKLYFHDFQKGEKTQIASNVMPRTIATTYHNLMWLDNNYTGHIILDMRESMEILEFENVLQTFSGSDQWSTFITVASDERLKIYETCHEEGFKVATD